MAADPQRLTGHQTTVGASAFSADSRFFATIDWDGVILVWDVANLSAAPQRLSVSGHNSFLAYLAFTGDGRYLLAASGTTISLWALDNLSAPPLRTSTKHTQVTTGLAVSADSTTVIVTSSSWVIELWTLADGELHFKAATNASGSIAALAASPTAASFAVGTTEGAVEVWSLDTLANPRRILRPHQGKVTALAYTPDGRTLISGSQDQTIKLTRTLESLIEQGCAQAKRNLTLDEWQQYLPDNAYVAVCPAFPAAK